jgi:hypothetical protein
MWAGPVLGCFGCCLDDGRVQMSPSTHYMSPSMDPQKTDTDEFQQIQSAGSMERPKLSQNGHAAF